MTVRFRRNLAAPALGALLLALLPLTGCPDKKETTNVLELKGTVEKIDLANRRVEVKAFLEKHQTYQSFTVTVNDETEILINGSLATLQDVREGEVAEGRVRVTRGDDKTVLTALAVSIDRGETLAAPGAAASPGAAATPAPTAAPADAGTTGAADAGTTGQ